MFALKNLIFTSYNFLESYPRWEEKKNGREMSHCEPYILFVMPHELMLHVMLCDMSHMICYKIRNEVAKLPPHTWSPSPQWVADANPADVHRVGWAGPGRARLGPGSGHHGERPTPAARRELWVPTGTPWLASSCPGAGLQAPHIQGGWAFGFFFYHFY
jgi:hypothetical protein